MRVGIMNKYKVYFEMKLDFTTHMLIFEIMCKLNSLIQLIM